MNPYSLTKQRTLQWTIIMLVLLGMVGGYFYYQSRAALRLNTSGEDSLTQGLVGYWNLDEGTGTSAADSSGNGLTGTLAGGTAWTTGKIDGAVDFDGTDGRVTVNDNDLLTPNHITLSAWVNLDTTVGTQGIISKRTTSGSNEEYSLFYWDQTSTENDGFYCRIKGQTSPGFYVVTPPTGTWLHVACVYDRNTVQMYYNGLPVGTAPSKTEAITNAGADLYLGALNNGSSHLNGQLDEARLYNRALTAQEIARLYRVTAPQDIEANLVGYWTFNQGDISGTTAIDKSGKGNNGTITGTSSTEGMVGQAITFGASSDKVQMSSYNGFPTSAITTSFWIKTTDAGNDGIIGYSSSGHSNDFVLYSSNSLQVLRGAASWNTGVSIRDGVWHHIVVTWQASDGTVRLYKDGVLVASSTLASGSNITSGGCLVLAQEADTHPCGGLDAAQTHAGTLDELRIYNVVLSESQIRTLYDFGAPDTISSGYGDTLTQGLAGYWKMDEGSGASTADSTGNNSAGTLVGNTSWTTGRIGSATSYDGNGDYTALTDGAYDSHSQGTVSAWIKFPAKPAADTAAHIFGVGSSSSTNALFIFNVYSPSTGDARLRLGSNMNTNYIYGDTNLAANTWHHVVATSDGSTNRLYVNGIQQALTVQSGTNTGKWIASSVSGTMRYSWGVTRRSTGNISYWSGQIDEGRIYDRPLSGEEIARLYRVTVPHDPDTTLVGYWNFDQRAVSGTNAYDWSGKGGTGTLSGGPTLAEGVVGQAVDLDGSNDLVNIPDHNRYTFGNGTTDSPFSLSAWVRADSIGATASWIITKRTNNTADEWQFNLNPAGQLGFAAWDQSADANIGRLTTISLTTGTWYHVASTYDGSRSSSGVRLYVNGVRVDTTDNDTGTYTAMENTSTNVRIGVWGDLSHHWNGKIDEVRIHSAALSEAQIRALYEQSKPDTLNATQGDMLTQGLAGYWKMDEGTGTSTADASGNGNTGSFSGSPVWATGKISSGLTFDGASRLTLGDPANLKITGRLTLSAWVKFSADISNRPFIARWGTDQSYVLTVPSTDANKLRFCIRVSDVSKCATSANTYNDGNWHHVVGRFNGANALLTVDGGRENIIGDATSGPIDAPAQNVAIGDYNNGTGGTGFNGTIDEARIYNRSLSDEEVARLYRVSAPQDVEPGLIGYWPFNGKDFNGTTTYDRSGKGNNGTVSGATKTEGKVGQGLLFDGNNDNISIADNPALDIGTSDFTLSAWVKGNSMANSDIFLAKSEGGGCSSSYGFLWGIFDSLYPTLHFCTTGGSHAKIQGTAALANGEWYHVVVVVDRDSTTNTRVYLNGVAIPTTISNLSSHTGGIENSTALVIGSESDGGFYWDGSMDEMRIYNTALSTAAVRNLYNLGR